MTKQSDQETRIAYSINEYCDAMRISRGTLYNLWKAGRGPRRMKIGCRTIISVEAAAEYQRRCESELAAKEAGDAAA
jgi:predicted DNA-binding transcriptional regulator AlpA